MCQSVKYVWYVFFFDSHITRGSVYEIQDNEQICYMCSRMQRGNKKTGDCFVSNALWITGVVPVIVLFIV